MSEESANIMLVEMLETMNRYKTERWGRYVCERQLTDTSYTRHYSQWKTIEEFIGQELLERKDVPLSRDSVSELFSFDNGVYDASSSTFHLYSGDSCRDLPQSTNYAPGVVDPGIAAKHVEFSTLPRV
jgi:hypothetical protein